MAKSDPERAVPARRTQAEQWLTLKDASDFLGVHYSTLRKWADEGEIPVFRTPGGHRRFSIGDLRRFLEERMGQSTTADSESVLSAAVDRVREEIQRMPQEHMVWAQSLTEQERDLTRQRGRQLFALAIAYVLKPAQREPLLAEGRKLGRDYGRDAADYHIGLTETGRAVQFFRSQLNQVLHSHKNSPGLDADDVRVQQLIDHYLDEILYAVLRGYEEAMTGNLAANANAAHDAPDDPPTIDAPQV